MIYRCPKCNGHAVGLPVLRRAVPDKLLKGLWLRAREAEEQAAGAECPICHSTMVELPVSADQQQVSVDVCTACQFVWFDASEFEQFPSLPPAEPSEQQRLPEKAREAIARMQLQGLQRREELDELEPGFEGEGASWLPVLLRMLLRG